MRRSLIAPALAAGVLLASIPHARGQESAEPMPAEDARVQIHGGTFNMGDIQGLGGDPKHRNDEVPIHTVTLGPFEIGAYEVTTRSTAPISTPPSSRAPSR